MLLTKTKWLLVSIAVIATWSIGLHAQNRNSPMARWWEPTNDLPNPWAGQLLPLPDRRTWGSTAGADQYLRGF
jgi:hypothetical protein